MDGNEINWVEIITKLGVTGVLIVNVWLFIKGKIWPEAMVEKTIEAQQKSADYSNREKDLPLNW